MSSIVGEFASGRDFCIYIPHVANTTAMPACIVFDRDGYARYNKKKGCYFILFKANNEYRNCRCSRTNLKFSI